jgi:OFA family oxalate/formate antiporter-like MFS transporter
MMAGLAAGFCVNANLRELFTGHSAWAATAAVAVFALANAAGRIAWGFWVDRIAPARAIALNLYAQAAVLIVFWGLGQPSALFLTFAFLAGFNYGGVLVIYAAAVARIWGRLHVGPVYGFLFSANIPAALAPLLAGLWFDARQSFGFPLALITLMLAAAALWIGRSGHDPAAGK